MGSPKYPFHILFCFLEVLKCAARDYIIVSIFSIQIKYLYFVRNCNPTTLTSVNSLGPFPQQPGPPLICFLSLQLHYSLVEVRSHLFLLSLTFHFKQCCWDWGRLGHRSNCAPSMAIHLTIIFEHKLSLG